MICEIYTGSLKNYRAESISESCD